MWFTPLLQGGAQQQQAGGATVVNSYRLPSTFGASPRSVTISPVATGNTLIVVVGVADSNQGAGVSVTDNQGNTYTQDLSFVPPNLDSDIFFFRASNITNAPTSVRCAFGSGSALFNFNILEVRGLDNASPVDATVFDATSTNSASFSKNISTNSANALVVCCLTSSISRTLTAGAGYSQLPNASTSDFDWLVWDNDVGAAGVKTVSGTFSTSGNWRSGVVAYKAASVSGPTIYRPTSDITTTGWTASSGAVLYDMIDESVASDADYISSPALGASPGPATFGIGSVPAGSYTVSIRARETAPDGEVRVVMRDAGGTAVGTSAWQALGLSFTTYSLSVSTSGTAAQLSVEVQSVGGGNDPQVAPSLTASRISGTAPLAVHFDATSTTSTRTADDFREITYSFNYGDAGSGTWATNGQSKNSDSGGPLGAHVYETPGTYTVTLTANDGTGSSSTTVSITVADPDTVYAGTNTICIDPSGGTTGGPAGCQYVTSMPTIQSNRRYLIKRGSTIAGFTIPNAATGVRIGAYGAGAKPNLTSALVFNNGSQPSTAQWVEDICVSDLNLQNGTLLIQSGRHIALLRCEVVNTTTPLDQYFYLGGETKYWATRTDQPPLISPSDYYTPQYVAVVECYQRGQFASQSGAFVGMYGGYDRLAFMGNDFRGSPEHNVRLTLARLSLIQHNILEDKTFDTGRHCIKLHGGGVQESWGPMGATFSPKSYQNIIRRNILGAADSICDWTVAVRPENRTAQDGVQGIEDTIVEDNSFINSATKSLDIVAGPAKKTTTRGNTRNDGAIRINQDTGTYPEPIQSSWRGPYYGQYTG